MRRLLIKFPSQIRISGWDFGSSARAMNQAGGFLIPQADLVKVIRSTTERKSMSTKTTIKRIALVAVSALGLGVVQSAMPANATIALGLSLNTSSITVVSTGSDSTTAKALVAITVTASDSATGLTSGETITASVIGVPTNVTTTKTVAVNGAKDSGDIGFLETKGQTSGSDISWTTFTADSGTGGAGQDGVINSGNAKYCNLDHTTTDASCKNSKSYTYFMALFPARSAVNQGVYTIAFDLQNSAGAVISRQTLKIDWVTTASASDAKLTVATAGTWFLGDTPTTSAAAASFAQTSTKNITATITNRDG